MQKLIIFALAVCGGISLVVLKSGSAAEIAATPSTPTLVAQPATNDFCGTKIVILVGLS